VRFDSFSSGEVIIRESDSGKSMYVIVSGEAVVVLTQGRSTENIVATLKAGDFFGEMSLLTGEPRTATVKAKSDVVCMKIEKEDLEEIMSAHSEVAAAMSEILVVRKEGLTELKDSIKKAEQGANKKLAGQFLAKIKSFFNIS
jgi:CRP-like cAMP-binding protein